MEGVTIRSIAPEELPTFMQAVERAFHGRWTEEDVEHERLVAEPDRFFVALDGDAVVGTAGACTTRLTVPGGSLPAPGVTAVGVLPSRRRQGINTRLMGTLLDQAAERDEPIAYLWASESPIYGRFGYGMASLCTELEMSPHRSAFVPGVITGGGIRALPREQALPLMRPIYDRVAASRPGMIAIDDRWWTWLFHERKRDEDEPLFFALHEDDDGAPDGYAVYKVKHEWVHSVPMNELRVQQLIAATPDATAALWRYLLDVDLIATVQAWDRPADEELFWLVAEPRRMKATLSDGLWLRLIDINRSLAGRRYASDGRLVFEVEDAFRPASSGHYELVVGAGDGACARTDAEPDLSLGVDALGSAYLGGISFRQLARAHQVRELAPGALARADSMFAWDPSPWFGFIF
ncbi:MAG: GNAT family N-acetyltransferase [Actinomycetota bacterium]